MYNTSFDPCRFDNLIFNYALGVIVLVVSSKIWVLVFVTYSKKKGAIINVSSVAAFTCQPLVSMYSASKAYVDFLSRGLSYEYSDKGKNLQKDV